MFVLKNLLRISNIPFTELYLDRLSSNLEIEINSLTVILDQYCIPNIAIHISPKHLYEISLPAIAHCQTKDNSFFVLLQRLQNNQISYYRENMGEVTETIEAFSEKWTGTVMMLAPDENSGEPNYEENKKKEQKAKLEKGLMWVALAVFTLIGLFFQSNIFLSCIFLLCGLGTITSIFLLQSEYGESLEWVANLCQLGTSSSQGRTIAGSGKSWGCNAVTQSAGGKIAGFSWAEIGLVYFGGSALSLSMVQFTMTQILLFSILHFITLPYVIYSFYYQAFVARSWCTLCLIVQGILVTIAAAWLGYYDWQFPVISPLNARAFSVPTVSIALVAAFWLYFKQIWQRERQLLPAERALEHWKNDSDLFLSHLYAQSPVQMKHLPYEDQIGNPEAPVIVTMVSNPHCNPCKEAYKELTGWVKYFEDEMQLKIRHIYSGEVHYQQHEKWAKDVGVEFTPTLFINGYRLRSPYSYQDIWKHVRALAEKPSMLPNPLSETTSSF